MHSTNLFPRHINIQSYETEEIPESLPSTSVKHTWDPTKLPELSRGIPMLAKGLVLKLFLGYTGLTASVKASLFCSSWASRSFCWDETKNVGYSWKQNEFRAEKLVIRHLKVLSIELPSTACIPGSRRTQGTSPRIFQQQSVETQQRVKTSPPLPPPYPKYDPRHGLKKKKTCLSIELVDDEMTEGGFEEVLLGTVFQQGVVHRVSSNLGPTKVKLHQRVPNRSLLWACFNAQHLLCGALIWPWAEMSKIVHCRFAFCCSDLFFSFFRTASTSSSPPPTF